jgi:hypothetical protein
LREDGRIAHERLGQAVRHGEEGQVDARPVHLGHGRELGQVEVAQVGEDGPHRLPRLAVGRERGHAQPGVARDEAHELGARIARGAQDGDGDWRRG